MKTKLALTVLLCCIATQVEADDHHKAFWRFLKGEWNYEITPINLKGTARWRLAAKGNATIGRFTGSDGSVAVEVGGWRKDSKTLVGSGYSSDGGYWHLELDKVTVDRVEGREHGILPDGRTYEGEFVGKKVDDDHYQWDFTGKTGNGEELKLTGKFERKK